MGGAFFDLLAVLLVLTILRARPSVVLVLMGASLLVVPGPLIVPHSPTTLLTFPHLITLAGAARLVIGRLDRSITREHLRITPPQVALLALLAVASIIGVGLSPASGGLGAAPGRLIDVLDHVVFLTVVLALTRKTSPMTAIYGLALGLSVGVAVTLVEHVTGDSFGHTVFSAVDDIHQSAAFPLSVRDGATRVRAGTEFALQYAWIAAMLGPALLLAAWRKGGAPLAALAGACTLLSVYWSFSRTALAATALLLLGTSTVLARRAGVWVLLTASALGGTALLLSQSLQDHLNPNTDIGSVQERTRRLSAVMDVVSHHPFRGVGLGELTTSGFRTTDFAFLIAYVELGVIGLVAVTACMLFALRSALPALRTTDPTLRDEGLVAVACVGTFIVSTLTYDAFTLIQGAHALWLGVAAGAVLVERRKPALPPLRWSAYVMGRAATAAGLGLILGLMVVQLAPSHTAQRAYFTVLGQSEETRLPYDPVTPAKRFVNTICTIAEDTAARGVKVSCEDTFAAAGVGQIRIQASNSFALREAIADFQRTVQTTARIESFRLLPVEAPRTGRDTWASTSPVWLALAGGVLALLVSPRRERQAGHALRRVVRDRAAAAADPSSPGPPAPAYH